MAFADGWLKSYREADTARKAPYGDAWAVRIAKTNKEGIESLAADPEQTVQALMRALTLLNPPSRMVTGWAGTLIFKPLSWLPDAMRDAILYKMSFPGEPPCGLAPLEHPLPPAETVSHLTIRVRNLNVSVPWYEKWGFVTVGPAKDGQQFLKSGKHAKWQPLLLLFEDSKMPQRGPSYDAGMTRLSLYVMDLQQSVKRLAALGIEPMAPPAGDKAGKIAAYKDPDGFVLYMVVSFLPMSPVFAAARWWNGVVDPQLFSWTINFEDIAKGLAAVGAFGFQKVFDLKPDQVQHDMLPAFGISATSTVIKYIRLAKLPNDDFIASLMEWLEPRTTRTGTEKLNSMAICVEDVGAALRNAASVGLDIEEPVRRTYPALGDALVGAAYIDGGSRIEFIRFARS